VFEGCGKSIEGEVRMEIYDIRAESLQEEGGVMREGEGGEEISIPLGTRRQRQLNGREGHVRRKE
jgi:hypothetical protein